MILFPGRDAFHKSLELIQNHGVLRGHEGQP